MKIVGVIVVVFNDFMWPIICRISRIQSSLFSICNDLTYACAMMPTPYAVIMFLVMLPLYNSACAIL